MRILGALCQRLGMKTKSIFCITDHNEEETERGLYYHTEHSKHWSLWYQMRGDFPLRSNSAIPADCRTLTWILTLPEENVPSHRLRAQSHKTLATWLQMSSPSPGCHLCCQNLGSLCTNAKQKYGDRVMEKERVALLLCQTKGEHSRLAAQEQRLSLWWVLLLLSCEVVSDSLWPYRLQHARPLCPPLSPGVCLNSRWWCYLLVFDE